MRNARNFLLTRKVLDLSSDPLTFLINVSNIFLAYLRSNFSAGFEDTLLYERYEDFCHLK